ncbi:hypothetical protein [Tsukamurella sp. USMM236]|uniref:hypothetical protein n=1 Tax=Tsukamurella sp. USMM236 TaxID=3081301 RepID=UPI003016EE20
MAVLLLSPVDFAVPLVDHRLPARLSLALAQGMIEDHRSAVNGLAAMSGWEMNWAPDWTRVDVADPVTGNSASLEFEPERGRFIRIQGRLSPPSV